MFTIIDEGKRLKETISKSLKEAGYLNCQIDGMIELYHLKFNKTRIYDERITNDPFKGTYLVEIARVENKTFVRFGEQAVKDFALNEEAIEGIAKLCRVIDEYFEESEKEE